MSDKKDNLIHGLAASNELIVAEKLYKWHYHACMTNLFP